MDKSNHARPTFSLNYTSVREDQISGVVNMWLKRADSPESVEVVIAIDSNNGKAIEAAKAVKNAIVVIQDKPPFNCVRGWNVGAAKTTGDVIINVADDFNPPEHWDTLLLNLSPSGWTGGEHVVHVASGYVEDIMVLSIATRKRYERFGYMLYPGYESLFSDTEFTHVAYRDGVVINAKHILFEHMHCDCGKRPKDQHDVVHGGKDRWVRGEMLFNYRKGINFPVDVGPNAVNVSAPSNDKYAVYIQATDDDFCLFEVCQRMIEEGARNFYVCIPDEYWSGKPTPQENIDKIRSVMAQVRDLGADVRIQVFNVKQYKFPGDTRIAVETRVRNDSLSWIRRDGFSHILIVDGDELWTRGLLGKVKDVVETSQPSCISVAMIPVVGLPGYPVHMASDRAVVYINGSATFRECRSPANEHYLLGNGIVIHFTACRKTMREIIEKHRASGHYDDPDYDFEGWIANVLPNLKPGWKGAHMYRKYQIWPLVRNWTISEMEQIPESLRLYLGAPVSEPSPIQRLLDKTSKGQQAPGAPKVHPFRLTQSEQFQGFSNNPFRF